MFNVSRLRRRPRLFGRLVGLSVEEFEVLLLSVEEEYARQHLARGQERPRVRDVGAGRGFVLPLEARLLSVLLYYRLHLTGALLGLLFELDESNLWRERKQRMEPVLHLVLPVPMQDHLLSAVEEALNPNTPLDCGGKKNARPRIGTLRELLEAYPELRDVCVDGTEQEVRRPKNKKASQQHYSGKSHAHTLKTQLTTCDRLVVHLMGNVPGSVADRQLLKASGVLRALSGAAPPTPRRPKHAARTHWDEERRCRRVRLDRGYSEIENLFPVLPHVQVLSAIKGRGRQKVTPLGRAWNAVMVSRKRIQIEQNIGHLKMWRVLDGVFRARRNSHQNTFALVAGLHNFHISGALSWCR